MRTTRESKELSKSLKLEIKLIDKISLTDEVMPILKKKISKILKTDKTNVLVTFCSRSKNPKVSSELKIYTQKLAKNLNISKAYSCFVGEETEFIKKIKGLPQMFEVTFALTMFFVSLL